MKYLYTASTQCCLSIIHGKTRLITFLFFCNMNDKNFFSRQMLLRNFYTFMHRFYVKLVILGKNTYPLPSLITPHMYIYHKQNSFVQEKPFMLKEIGYIFQAIEVIDTSGRLLITVHHKPYV